MTATERNTGGLLLNGACPFEYDCKDMDCMKCVQIHTGERRTDDA